MSCNKCGGAHIQVRADRVTVWVPPAPCDLLAYVLPALFCGAATAVGIFLVHRFGARYLLLALPAALALGAFILAGVRAVQRVRVDDAGVWVSARAVVACDAVTDITTQPGDARQAGIIVHTTHGRHIVLHGLPENERDAATAVLLEAVRKRMNAEFDDAPDLEQFEHT